MLTEEKEEEKVMKLLALLQGYFEKEGINPPDAIHMLGSAFASLVLAVLVDKSVTKEVYTKYYNDWCEWLDEEGGDL